MSAYTTVILANEIFGKKLFAITDTSDNLILSSICAHTLWTLVLAGAQGNTSANMAKVLAIPDISKTLEEYSMFLTEIRAHVGNSFINAIKFYVAEEFTLKPEFVNLIENKFELEIQQISFDLSKNAPKIINAWVEEQTNGKVKHVVEPNNLLEKTNFYLANIVYFKGPWKFPFIQKYTQENDFYLLNGSKVRVMMMFQEDVDIRMENSERLDATVFEIPYTYSNLRMLIFLPNKTDGLPELEEKMADFNFYIYDEKFRVERCNIYLPRMKLECNLDLKSLMLQLGMEKCFSDQANYSGIAQAANSRLKINEVFQKVYIEITEEGSKSAAAAAVGIMLMSMPTKLIVDHPFLFVILYETNVLFFGRILNPLDSESRRICRAKCSKSYPSKRSSS